jgi:hypothetical protein
VTASEDIDIFPYITPIAEKEKKMRKIGLLVLGIGAFSAG